MTAKRFKPGDPCPYCERRLTPELFHKRDRLRALAVKAGLAESKARGTKLGRPLVEIDMELLGALRAKGWTYRQLGKELGCSVSVIQRIYNGERKTE